jgi:hypothetical protein
MTPGGQNFHVTLLIGRRLFWEVDATGIIEVPDAMGCESSLVSFDVHDHRLRARRVESTRSAMQCFMREWGERVRLVNLSRELGAHYGREPSKGPARPPGCPLYSGPQLIDRLARGRAIDLANRMVGLCLGSAESHGRRLVLLFAYDAQGELVRFQEAANPPSLEYLVEDFCRGLAAPLGDPVPCWFTQQDVAAVLPSMRPYPEQDVLLDIPLQRWWTWAASLSWAVTTLSVLTAVWAACDLWQAQQEQHGVRGRIAALESSQASALASHLRALAHLSSANVAQAFADAEALWRTGSRVRVLAAPSYLEYSVLLAQPPALQGARQVDSMILPAPLGTALEMPGPGLPAGLRRLDSAVSGDLRGYYLRFRRETALPALAALAAAEP